MHGLSSMSIDMGICMGARQILVASLVNELCYCIEL